MSTLYVHPADSRKNSEPYQDENYNEHTNNQYYEDQSYHRNNGGRYDQRESEYDNNNNNNGYSRYKYRNQHRSHVNKSEYSTEKQTTNNSQHPTQSVAPPSLFFPLQREQSASAPPNGFVIEATPEPPMKSNHNNMNNNFNNNMNNNRYSNRNPNQYQTQQQQQQIQQEQRQQQELDNSSGHPIQSTSNVLANNFTSDFGSLYNLSVDEIQNILKEQTYKNESLLIKLRDDQKKYVKIDKHYDKKIKLLKGTAISLEKQNGISIQSAEILRSLINQHKNEIANNQKERYATDMSSRALWKAVTINMQLLSDVNGLNKQIDNFHVLIAKKNQERQINRNKNGKTKSTKIQSKWGEQKQPEEVQVQVQVPHNISFQSPTQLIMNDPDPTTAFANRLIAKNKRYNEMLRLLRNRVDELRECRKNL